MNNKKIYIEVLEAVQSEGSINAASKLIGVSFRGAHKRLEKLQKIYSEKPIIYSFNGGIKRGGTLLTSFGYEILKKLKSDEIS